jgi:hypothetical protein
MVPSGLMEVQLMHIVPVSADLGRDWKDGKVRQSDRDQAGARRASGIVAPL